MQNKFLSEEDISNLKKISSWSYRFYSLYLMITQKEDVVLNSLKGSIGNYSPYVFRNLYALHLAEDAFYKLKAEPDSLQKQNKLEKAEKILMVKAVNYSIAKITYIKNMKDKGAEIIHPQDEYNSSLYFLKGYYYYKRSVINDMKGNLELYKHGFYTNSRIIKYASYKVIYAANLQNDGVKYKVDSPATFLAKEKFNHVESVDNKSHVAVNITKRHYKSIIDEIKYIDIKILKAKAKKAQTAYKKYYEQRSLFKYLFYKMSFYLIILQLSPYGKRSISYYYGYDFMDVNDLVSKKNEIHKKLKLFNSKDVKEEILQSTQKELLIFKKLILDDAISRGLLDVVDEMLQDFNITQNNVARLACEAQAAMVHKSFNCEDISQNNAARFLLVAEYKGQAAIVYKLLNCKNISQNNAASFLLAAACKGQAAMVHKLLNCENISQNLDDFGTCEALISAIIGGYYKVADILIDLLDSKNVREVSIPHGNTALILAAYNGHDKIVGSLLKLLSINVNIPNHNDVNALMIAADMGHDKIVEKLLSVEDIDVNITGRNDFTALMLEAEMGHDGIAEKLLNAEGIKVNIKSENGDTALILAAKNGHDKIVEKLLNAKGIKVNIKSENGNTALILAAKNGYDKIVEKLLNAQDIDVNIQGQYLDTALIGAAENGHNKIVEKLLKIPDIDVNVKDKYDATALIGAARNGHNKIVENLLKIPGIDVNVEDQCGDTALMRAAQNGHRKIVENLLKIPGGHINNSWLLALKFAISNSRPLILLFFTRNEPFNIIYNRLSAYHIDKLNSYSKVLDYLVLSGHATISDFKTDVGNKLVRRVIKSSSLLSRANNESLRFWEKSPSRLDVIIASMFNESLKEETIEKYSGMKMSRFVEVRELIRCAKITNILYGCNYYIFIYILILRNSASSNCNNVSTFNYMPSNIKRNLLEFIVGEFATEKDNATPSVSLLEHSSKSSVDTKRLSGSEHQQYLCGP